MMAKVAISRLNLDWRETAQKDVGIAIQLITPQSSGVFSYFIIEPLLPSLLKLAFALFTTHRRTSYSF